MVKGIGRRGVLGGLALLGAAPARAAPATVSLTFLHFNDVYRHGPLGDYGGLAEMATLLSMEQSRAPGAVFRTFGGDVISPSITSSITHGSHMIRLLNALGIELSVLGNHEFDFGAETAVQRIAESRFPWLGANVLGPDGKPFGGTVATVMREAAGLHVGFVGILTAATARLAPRTDGVHFSDEAAALAAGAAALRRGGADIVIAMTHQDLPADLRMAEAVPGIDLILGGHDHEPMELQNAPGVPILKAASDARFLAVAELRVVLPQPGEPASIRSVAWKLVPNVDIAPDPAVAALILTIDAQIDGVLSAPVGRLAAPLDSRVRVVRGGEAALGNLVADALRAYFHADAALLNGGALRGNRLYPAGQDLTRRDFMAEMPFGNVVEELEVSGAALAAALENGLSGLEDGAGRFPQTSGIRFTYDPSAPPGYRLGTVMVAGEPLDRARPYKLATTDFLAAGGDGYGMLKEAKVLVDAAGGPLLVNVAADSVAASAVIDARTEGRATAVRK